MKKNLRLVSVAAAALLAVAPVVSTAIPVNADVTLNNAAQAPTSTVKYNPQFYYNGTALNNGATIPTSISIKNEQTLGQIAKAVNDSKVQIQYYDYKTGQLTSENINVTAEYIKTELQKISSVQISTGGKADDQVVTGLPASGFNLELNYGQGSNAARAYLPVGVDGNQANVDVNLPVFNVTDNGKKTSSRAFNIASGSNFNPTSFTTADGHKIEIGAQQSTNSSNNAAVTVTSNPVDTAQAGRFYTVTLRATNAIGKTADLSYQVMVVSSGAQTLPADTPTYGLYVNNAVATGNTLKAGSKIYVGSQTRTIDNVSYTKISTISKADADSNSSNLWIQTSALTAQPSNSDTNTQTETVMIDSRAYDKNGNYLGHMYYAYDSINIVPTVVTINGKTYYKVANKDEYVRVTNITGNQRTLRHNAYIYWSSYRRTPGTGKMYRGQTVTTYGPAMRFKNGKKYYRIEGCRNNNKRYIKAVNFY